VLEVRINGMRSPLLWQFVQLPDGTLAITAERLRLLGFNLRTLGVAPDTPLVRLSGLSGISYRYSEPDQSIAIDAVNAALVPVVLDKAARPAPLDINRIESNFGAVLNYALHTEVSGEGVFAAGRYDFRLLSSLGVLSTTGFASYASKGDERFDHVRLDTSWRYVDARHVLAFTLGDTIADGGQLGAAYRMGGIQIQRDYESRPDLVSSALPTLNGTAAVPSTVDLYINGMRYYSGETGRGPFQFRSLPNLGGGATATVVMTDATGQETRIRKAIFFVPGLLPSGKLDFSFEAGFPRLRYADRSFDYFHQFAASGTMRHGVTDWFTVQGHTEHIAGLINAGLGSTIRIGGFGSIAAGLAGSRFRGTTGTRYSIDARARLIGINLYGGIERANADYQDIVTVTTIRAANGSVDNYNFPIAGRIAPILTAFSRKTDRVGANFTALDTGVNMSFTRVKLADQQLRMASASLNRTVARHVSVWLNGYKNFGDGRDYGIFAGITLPLGGLGMASNSVSQTRNSTMMTTSLSHNAGDAEGGLGWNLVNNQPLSGSSEAYRSANLRYVTHNATVGGGVEQYGGQVYVSAFAEGSMVAMGGGLFLTPQIDSSFAIVRGAGIDTPVLVNTRAITHTDSQGRALVSSLRSLEKNIVGIDPTQLPVDMKPARTAAEVIPGDRSGVIIDFGVAPEPAAILILIDSNGQPLAVGSRAFLEGSNAEAIIGYDGRTYMTGLASHNRIRVELPKNRECSAEFDFTPKKGQQVLIGPIACQ